MTRTLPLTDWATALDLSPASTPLIAIGNNGMYDSVNCLCTWHVKLFSDYVRRHWSMTLTGLQASRLVKSITRIEVAQHYTSQTLSGQPDGDAQHYTLALHMGLCIGPAREAGLSIGTWRGHVPPCKERKIRPKICSENVVEQYFAKSSVYQGMGHAEHGSLQMH